MNRKLQTIISNRVVPFRILLAAVALATVGCGQTATIDTKPELTGPFDTVRRSLEDDASVGRAMDANLLPKGAVKSNGSFYLAIHKNELGKKWFLSAYLTQLFPRTFPAAFSLGTRVVSFEVQNGKLFVFDVDDRKKTSDFADPRVIVEAYPIVTNWAAYSQIINASQYVIFDPAAGLNRFEVVADAFSSSAGANRFEVDLMFNQNFRSVADGVTYEQVFTGHSELADPSVDGSLERNLYRSSGTIGVALRRYSEGAGYSPTAMPSKEHYFRSDTKLVNGFPEETAAKWNIKPGMKPINWVISSELRKVQQNPAYAAYDIEGAIKAGIENWNPAFGFKAFQATVGTASDSPGNDDTNFLHVDSDFEFGFAFANWRTNPNTGEIRGASIYFSALWIEIGDLIFEDDTATPLLVPNPDSAARLAKVQKRPTLKTLSWVPMPAKPLCSLHPAEFLEAIAEGGNASANALLTKKQKVERYIAHVVAHEVGHTLGLRHNFKGSLKPTSSSVMEYIDDTDAIFHDKPGSYDTEAVRYLYGLSTTLPTDPFCTDEGTRVDPYCATFDRTDDPLNKDAVPTYDGFVNQFLAARTNFTPNVSLNNVLKFMRAAPLAVSRQQAWTEVSKAITVPVDPAKLASGPSYGARVDFLTRVVYNRIYLDPVTSRGRFTADPTDPAINAQILSQLKGVLDNSDGIRSYATRRLTVDVLKKLQSLSAYQVLYDAREALLIKKATLTGPELLLAQDLIGRIDAAIRPYFVK